MRRKISGGTGSLRNTKKNNNNLVTTDSKVEMPSGKCVFNPGWRKKYAWLSPAKESKSKANCNVCHKEFLIGSMGESAIKSHVKSEKHKKLSGHSSSSNAGCTLDIFMKHDRQTEPIRVSETDPSHVKTPSTSDADVCVRNFVSGNRGLEAEILWTIHCITNHSSYHSNEGISNLFHRMFPDSELASKFTCGETKTRYLTVFGIADHFKNNLMNSISGPFVVLFDESLNKKMQEKQMDIHLRFWDEEKTEAKVVTRYFGSTFMGHGTAKDMVRHFQDAVFDQVPNADNLLQISMDGPNVNWAFYNIVQEQIQKDYNHSLVDIGSCGLHTVHNAFKAGATSTGWDVGGILSALYYLFKDSPARREDYTTCVVESGTSMDAVMPLKYVQHRWLENVPVVKRAIKIWPLVQGYVKKVEAKVFTKPTCKSYEVISNACKDGLLLAKLEFFNTVAKVLYPFLVNFQTDKPMVPFLGSELTSVIKTLMRKFIKGDVLEKHSTSTDKLLRLNIEDSGNHVGYKSVDLGLCTQEKLKGLKVSDRQLMDFRMESKGFLIKSIMKLKEKSPITYSLVRNLSSISPVAIASDKPESKDRFKKVVKKIISTKWIDSSEGDIILTEYDNLLDSIPSIGVKKFTDFNPYKDRLDEFYMDLNLENKERFCHLIKFIKLILIISHGQAQVERGFSVNKQVECENMLKQTVVAQRIICDYMFYIGGLNNFVVSKQLMLSAQSARQRYHSYLDKKREDEKSEEQKRKRKSIHDEIECLKKKRKQAKTDETSLIQSADKLCKQAENLGKLELLAQANSNREKSREKKKLFESLSKKLEDKAALLKD